MYSFQEYFHINRIHQIPDIYRYWLKPGINVLDVGSGDGILAYYIAQKLKLKIHGCDIDNYLYKKIPFTLMSEKTSLPFRRYSFNAVIFNDVLHHMNFQDQQLLLNEAARVSKNMIIVNEVIPSLGAYIEDYVLNKISHHTMPIPLSFRTTSGWESLFRKLRLTVKAKVYSHSTFSLVSHVFFCLTNNRRV